MDLKSGTPVWADLQSISLHAKAASGIKRVIKESLVIQISHAYGVMSESCLRERSAEKPFQVGGGRLSSQWSHFALIQFCIVFDSEVVRFLSENWPLFVYLLCFLLQGRSCSAANRPQSANRFTLNNLKSATYSA